MQQQAPARRYNAATLTKMLHVESFQALMYKDLSKDYLKQMLPRVCASSDCLLRDLIFDEHDRDFQCGKDIAA
jgi:hypothetical protein